MNLYKNRYLLLIMGIMIMLITMSFYQYYDEYFGYSNEYYAIKENCYEKKDLDKDYCSMFPTTELIENYVEVYDPVENYKKLDAISLTINVVEYTKFGMLQFISPLLIIIIVVGTVHDEFSSGMLRNKLTRKKYRFFLIDTYKIAIKSALVMPFSLLLVFSLSCVFTKFNFTISDSVVNSALYNVWKYSNFILYGVIILLTQFFISILYANIGLFFCKINKSKLISMVMGYVSFLVIDIGIYIVLYVYIINKLLGFENLTDYFNITGYWFFDDGPIGMIVLPISIFLAVISTWYLYLQYKNKEVVIIENEKQIA